MGFLVCCTRLLKGFRLTADPEHESLRNEANKPFVIIEKGKKRLEEGGGTGCTPDIPAPSRNDSAVCRARTGPPSGRNAQEHPSAYCPFIATSCSWVPDSTMRPSDMT